MASTYNYLGIEKMATGENAGTWGTKTNTNLDIIQQAASGYHSQTIAGGAQTTALLMTDGDATSTTDSLTNAARNTVIELTGAITGNQIVTFPTSTEGLKVVYNNTTDGSDTYTVQIKGASDSGSGTTFAAGSAGRIKKLVYMSGTDLVEVSIAGDVTASSTTTFTNKTFTAPKYADGGFVADANGNENLVWGTTGSAVNEFKIANAATGSGPTLTSQGGDDNVDVNITPKGTGNVVLAGDTVAVGDSGAAATLTSNGAGTLTVTTGGATDLVLSTNTGTNSGTVTITDGVNGNIAVTPNGSGAILLDGLSWPTADGTADYVLKTDGSASLSWTEVSGGTSWQAVDTTGFTAVAGEGYFCNTTGGAFTATLPAGTLGDECTFVDYAATFDSNNLTIGRNGSDKINGSAADLTVAVERAAFTLVFTDSTQGWLLKDK